MPSGLAPLCPSCLERVPAWTAGSCPSCRKSSTVAACDRCMRSRAGAFVPEAPDGKDGGAQRCLCVDCMEKVLEDDVSERMRDTVIAVLVVGLVVWYRAKDWFVYALFAATAACFVAWWWAATIRREPAKHARAVGKLFRSRVERALRKRARSLS